VFAFALPVTVSGLGLPSMAVCELINKSGEQALMHGQTSTSIVE